MQGGPRVVLVSILALVVGGTWSCSFLKKRKQQKEAVEFNNKLVAFNKRLHDDASELGELVGKRISGKKVTDKALDDGLAKLKATVASVRRESKAMKVPDDPLARELFESYEVFLDGQEKLVGKIGDLVALAKKPIGPKGKGRAKLVRAVRPILKAVQQQEQASLKALKALQRRYAAKHNITLM